MKDAFCPMKRVCRDDCTNCIFSMKFRQMGKRIAKLTRQKKAMERELARYRELGTVEELAEALQALYC